MSTELLLVRHAACEQMAERLVGRGEDVPLTAEGRSQVEALADCFAREKASHPVAAVYCSPRRRTRETAAAVACAVSCEVTVDDHFDEVDFGEWTGRRFSDLHDDPRWQHWNQARSHARAPDGESMVHVQRRLIERLEALTTQHRDERFVVVTHSEIIRTAVLHYLGLPLEAYTRIEISPASRCLLHMDPWGVKIMTLNEQVPA